MQRSTTFASLAALAFALLLPAAPADASEVVKLARLVITGKRLSADHRELGATEKPAVQKLPPVLIEGQSAVTQNQAVQLALHRRGLLRAL